MENLIEIIKESANCNSYDLTVNESEFGTKVYIWDNLGNVYFPHISLSLNELLSIDTKARQTGYFLLNVSTNSAENHTYLILTFVKL
jgi:hypothetical protein